MAGKPSAMRTVLVRRTAIAPPRYHAALAAHSVRLSNEQAQPFGSIACSRMSHLCGFAMRIATIGLCSP